MPIAEKIAKRPEHQILQKYGILFVGFGLSLLLSVRFGDGGTLSRYVNIHESEETIMKEFNHVIKDPLGLHARPAGMLVKAVGGYASKVTLTAPTGTADARRLMAVMRLAAKQGMELNFKVEGADEEKAAAELQAFLAENL